MASTVCATACPPLVLRWLIQRRCRWSIRHSRAASRDQLGHVMERVTGLVHTAGLIQRRLRQAGRRLRHLCRRVDQLLRSRTNFGDGVCHGHHHLVEILTHLLEKADLAIKLGQMREITLGRTFGQLGQLAFRLQLAGAVDPLTNGPNRLPLSISDGRASNHRSAHPAPCGCEPSVRALQPGRATCGSASTLPSNDRRRFQDQTQGSSL